MDFADEARALIGQAQVLTGADMAKYATDVTGRYVAAPLAVARPANTSEVSGLMKLAHARDIPVVPIGGNTGLSGATYAPGALMISLERMNAIREIRVDARLAIVDAGVIQQQLHEAVAAHGLRYPMVFGARGSCQIGGNLATNAGGSNVLRFGNTRALCLGIEVVLPDGEVMDLMSELHKDNSGYDLRDLFIGAEGTLGIITAAVLKLVPAPRAHATAMVAVPDLPSALRLLNALQEQTGGAVEAFEFMPRSYMARLGIVRPDLIPPLGADHDISILVEVGATSPRDAAPLEDGTIAVVAHLQDVLGAQLEDGALIDAVVAQSETQRALMWDIREAAAEIILSRQPIVDSDVAVPLDQIATFLERCETRLQEIDPGAESITVSHLGDGNLHYSIWPTSEDETRNDAIREMVEDVTCELRGSFSAEHGIGITKLPSMTRRKDPIAMKIMRQVKAAIDPKGLMNPGKLLP
ncbi:MAG: FAD-binding oxidoreductase [Paracoccaceae bacterium]